MSLYKELTMNPAWKLSVPLMFALVAIPGGAGGADLLTIEQAEALSKATGRPILAMGGSKT